MCRCSGVVKVKRNVRRTVRGRTGKVGNAQEDHVSPKWTCESRNTPAVCAFLSGWIISAGETQWSGENGKHHTSQSVELGFSYSSMLISSSSPPSMSLISDFLTLLHRELLPLLKNCKLFSSSTLNHTFCFTFYLLLHLFLLPSLSLSLSLCVDESSRDEERSHRSRMNFFFLPFVPTGPDCTRSDVTANHRCHAEAIT